MSFMGVFDPPSISYLFTSAFFYRFHEKEEESSAAEDTCHHFCHHLFSINEMFLV